MDESSLGRLVGYFQRSVLALYQVSPEKYVVLESGLSGEVKLTDTYYESLPEEERRRWYFRIRFGYRRLSSGEVCLAVFLPDLRKSPEEERNRWLAQEIRELDFTKRDPEFQDWVSRYLHGSWEGEIGQLSKLKEKIRKIRSLTEFALGEALFRHEDNSRLGFPLAENTDAYRRAHEMLYSYLIDGLSLDALDRIGGKSGIPRPKDWKSLGYLRLLLSDHLKNEVCEPLHKCRDIRNRTHALSSDIAVPMQAYTEFRKDLTEILEALERLQEWLEGVLRISAESCVKREAALKYFPKIVDLPVPILKLEEIKKAVGKTIKSIEFGATEKIPNVHQNEAMIIHFEDGSSLGVDVGSNIGNLCADHENLNPNDLILDLIVQWADSVRENRHHPE